MPPSRRTCASPSSRQIESHQIKSRKIESRRASRPFVSAAPAKPCGPNPAGQTLQAKPWETFWFSEGLTLVLTTFTLVCYGPHGGE
eukprot:1873806-Pyramimonas_sp.AAC.1